MSCSSGPNIVNDGLILHLDAANSSCLIPGGTSCYNLVTGGLVTGASGQPDAGTHIPNTANFPVHNSMHAGVFDFSGGRGMNCEEDLGAHSEITIEMWLYKISSAQEYILDGRNNAGAWYISNYTSKNYNFSESLSYNYDALYDAASPNFLNQWTQMVVTSDSNGSKLYLQGAEVSTYVAQNSINENLGVNYRIGTRYTTSGQWTGFMGPILIYNRALISGEINQNFNSLRQRFNIK